MNSFARLPSTRAYRTCSFWVPERQLVLEFPRQNSVFANGNAIFFLVEILGLKNNSASYHWRAFVIEFRNGLIGTPSFLLIDQPMSMLSILKRAFPFQPTDAHISRIRSE